MINFELKQHCMLLCWASLACVFLALCIIGAMNNYSSIPLWDMWGGYIDFYLKVSAGDLAAWWQQHNEHRILLSHLLFWFDIRFFSGKGLFLIFVNYLLLAFICLSLCLALRDRLKTADSFPRNLLTLVIITLSFSWTQRENLTWAFQSQFFLAQLLPFLSFYLLHRAANSQKHHKLYFILSIFSGFAAIAAMANGILALVVLTFMAVFLRLKWYEILIIMLTAVLAIMLFFYGYDLGVSAFQTVLSQPKHLLQYLLMYFGGPIYFMSRARGYITQLGGLFFLIAWGHMIWQTLKNPKPASIQLALLSFILYIVLSAVFVAIGRFYFGVEQAVSSRYMTPMLMAWLSLLILYAPLLAPKILAHPILMSLLLSLPALFLLQDQKQALLPSYDMYFERKISALALELGVEDKQQIALVTPNVDKTLEISAIASDRQISIFADPLFKNVKHYIGSQESVIPLTQCQGAIEEIVKGRGDDKYLQIRGWILDPHSQHPPISIDIVDNRNMIVGYGFTGLSRPVIHNNSVVSKAELSGFKAYLLIKSAGEHLRLIGHQPDCQLNIS